MSSGPAAQTSTQPPGFTPENGNTTRSTRTENPNQAFQDRAFNAVVVGSGAGFVGALLRGAPLITGTVSYAVLATVASIPYYFFRDRVDTTRREIHIAALERFGNKDDEASRKVLRTLEFEGTDMYSSAASGAICGGIFSIIHDHVVNQHISSKVMLGRTFGFGLVAAGCYMVPEGLDNVRRRLVGFKKWAQSDDRFGVEEKKRIAKERGEWTKGTIFPEWVPIKQPDDEYSALQLKRLGLRHDIRDVKKLLQERGVDIKELEKEFQQILEMEQAAKQEQEQEQA